MPGLAFYVEDNQDRRIPADLVRRLFRKLQMIDDSTCDQDLRVPPSNHFEKLAGALRGWHSIRGQQAMAPGLQMEWQQGRGFRDLLGQSRL